MANGYSAITPPTCCAFCREPWKLTKDGSHYSAWRSTDGQVYCDEYCADAAEEESVLAHGRVK